MHPVEARKVCRKKHPRLEMKLQLKQTKSVQPFKRKIILKLFSILCGALILTRSILSREFKTVFLKKQIILVQEG